MGAYSKVGTYLMFEDIFLENNKTKKGKFILLQPKQSTKN